MKFIALLALVATVQSVKIRNSEDHACDLLEADGSEIDTSLAVQLKDDVNVDQFKALAGKLDIELTPELLSLGSNEAVSNALIEVALGMGKSEDDISKAMGA